MHELLQWDISLFRWINQQWACPLLDKVMPFFSHPGPLIPFLFLLGAVLAWRGRARTRFYIFLIFLWVLIVNNTLVGWLKDWIARPRPFEVLEHVRLLVGRGHSYAMPSGHAANWFAAVGVTLWFYPRWLRILLPIAVIVGISRVYNGVHYPSDVLAGAWVGFMIGWLGPWLTDFLWRFIGRYLFPLWYARYPTLLKNLPESSVSARLNSLQDIESLQQVQWHRLGLLFLLFLTVARLWYLQAGIIELSKDEAYQWLWAKHLDWSYYSKPPLIAWLQFLSTSAFGDTEFGVRFFAPIFTSLTGFFLFEFLHKRKQTKEGLLLLLLLTAAPLTAVGGVLFTVDVPLVAFSIAGVLAGWKALQEKDAKKKLLWWIGVGLLLGIAFLSKYTALMVWGTLLLYITINRRSRKEWKHPGLYAALAITLLCMIPVIVWNAQHDWITLTHLKERGGLNKGFHLTTRYLLDFTMAQFGLLNPIFFLGVLWAVWGTLRDRNKDPLEVYLLTLSGPIYFGHWLYSLQARVQPNWIVVAVPLLFTLMILRGRRYWEKIRYWAKPLLNIGIGVGLLAVLLAHQSDWIYKITGHPLPPRLDPLRRVRYWSDLATLVEKEREKLVYDFKKETFIIGSHYGITSLMTFYIPEAKQRIQHHQQSLVYYIARPFPKNQFFFWPGYENRVGQNALFVIETDRPRPVPEALKSQFQKVQDLGMRTFSDHGRIMRQVQLFACFHLQDPSHWFTPYKGRIPAPSRPTSLLSLLREVDPDLGFGKARPLARIRH